MAQGNFKKEKLLSFSTGSLTMVGAGATMKRGSAK